MGAIVSSCSFETKQVGTGRRPIWMDFKGYAVSTLLDLLLYMAMTASKLLFFY